MEMTKESWDALVAGQIRDRERIADLQWRMVKMSKQVEKLSWMLEREARDFSRFYEEEFGYAGDWTLEDDVDNRLEWLEVQYRNTL